MNKNKTLKKKAPLKTFVVGRDREELRMQLTNFLDRMVTIKSPKKDRSKVVSDMAVVLKMDGKLSDHHLSVPQMQYRVLKMKRILDNARKNHKNRNK